MKGLRNPTVLFKSQETLKVYLELRFQKESQFIIVIPILNPLITSFCKLSTKIIKTLTNDPTSKTIHQVIREVH